MKRVPTQAWYYYFCFAFILTFIVFYPVQWLLLQKRSWYPAAHRYRSAWARVILLVWGVRYKVINPQFLHPMPPVIICSNHSSYLDILVLLAVFPRPMSFMAKAELSDIPLFGIFFKTIDIEVDRGSGEGGAKAYRQAVKISERGFNLAIFPEGGIHPEPLVVKPFKDGAFQLAIRHKMAILPVGLPDNHKILPDETRLAKPGKIRVILHEPLLTTYVTLKEIHFLKEELADIIQKDIIA